MWGEGGGGGGEINGQVVSVGIGAHRPADVLFVCYELQKSPLSLTDGLFK